MSQQLSLFDNIERLTVNEAIAIFHEIEGKNKSRSYRYQYKPIGMFFVDRYIDTITPVDVANYRASREQDGLKASAINREHSVITRLFNALKEWRRFGTIGPYNFVNVKLPLENPGQLVSKADELPFARNLVLTPMEFTRFCDYAHPRVRIIVILAMLTLLRRKNLKMLNKQNFNHALKQLTLTQSKTGKPITIPACETVTVIIGGSKYDCPCDFTNFRKLFDRAKEESGVHFWMTDLRRTGATQMLLDGIDLRTIQRYLGHTTLVMTERYLQPPVQHMVQASEKIEMKMGRAIELAGFSTVKNS